MIIYQQDPTVINESKEFLVEFRTRITPIFEAQESGTVGVLYNKYNSIDKNEFGCNGDDVEVLKLVIDKLSKAY